MNELASKITSTETVLNNIGEKPLSVENISFKNLFELVYAYDELSPAKLKNESEIKNLIDGLSPAPSDKEKKKELEERLNTAINHEKRIEELLKTLIQKIAQYKNYININYEKIKNQIKEKANVYELIYLNHIISRKPELTSWEDIIIEKGKKDFPTAVIENRHQAIELVVLQEARKLNKPDSSEISPAEKNEKKQELRQSINLAALKSKTPVEEYNYKKMVQKALNIFTENEAEIKHVKNIFSVKNKEKFDGHRPEIKKLIESCEELEEKELASSKGSTYSDVKALLIALTVFRAATNPATFFALARKVTKSASDIQNEINKMNLSLVQAKTVLKELQEQLQEKIVERDELRKRSPVSEASVAEISDEIDRLEEESQLLKDAIVYTHESIKSRYQTLFNANDDIHFTMKTSFSFLTSDIMPETPYGAIPGLPEEIEKGEFSPFGAIEITPAPLLNPYGALSSKKVEEELDDEDPTNELDQLLKEFEKTDETISTTGTDSKKEPKSEKPEEVLIVKTPVYSWGTDLKLVQELGKGQSGISSAYSYTGNDPAIKALCDKENKIGVKIPILQSVEDISFFNELQKNIVTVAGEGNNVEIRIPKTVDGKNPLLKFQEEVITCNDIFEKTFPGEELSGEKKEDVPYHLVKGGAIKIGSRIFPCIFSKYQPLRTADYFLPTVYANIGKEFRKEDLEKEALKEKLDEKSKEELEKELKALQEFFVEDGKVSTLLMMNAAEESLESFYHKTGYVHGDATLRNLYPEVKKDEKGNITEISMKLGDYGQSVNVEEAGIKKLTLTEHENTRLPRELASNRIIKQSTISPTNDSYAAKVNFLLFIALELGLIKTPEELQKIIYLDEKSSRLTLTINIKGGILDLEKNPNQIVVKTDAETIQIYINNLRKLARENKLDDEKVKKLEFYLSTYNEYLSYLPEDPYPTTADGKIDAEKTKAQIAQELETNKQKRLLGNERAFKFILTNKIKKLDVNNAEQLEKFSRSVSHLMRMGFSEDFNITNAFAEILVDGIPFQNDALAEREKNNQKLLALYKSLTATPSLKEKITPELFFNAMLQKAFSILDLNDDNGKKHFIYLFKVLTEKFELPEDFKNKDENYKKLKAFCEKNPNPLVVKTNQFFELYVSCNFEDLKITPDDFSKKSIVTLLTEKIHEKMNTVDAANEDEIKQFNQFVNELKKSPFVSKKMDDVYRELLRDKFRSVNLANPEEVKAFQEYVRKWMTLPFSEEFKAKELYKKAEEFIAKAPEAFDKNFLETFCLSTYSGAEKELKETLNETFFLKVLLEPHTINILKKLKDTIIPALSDEKLKKDFEFLVSHFYTLIDMAKKIKEIPNDFFKGALEKSVAIFGLLKEEPQYLTAIANLSKYWLTLSNLPLKVDGENKTLESWFNDVRETKEKGSPVALNAIQWLPRYKLHLPALEKDGIKIEKAIHDFWGAMVINVNEKVRLFEKIEKLDLLKGGSSSSSTLPSEEINNKLIKLYGSLTAYVNFPANPAIDKNFLATEIYNTFNLLVKKIENKTHHLILKDNDISDIQIMINHLLTLEYFLNEIKKGLENKDKFNLLPICATLKENIDFLKARSKKHESKFELAEKLYRDKDLSIGKEKVAGALDLSPDLSEKPAEKSGAPSVEEKTLSNERSMEEELAAFDEMLKKEQAQEKEYARQQEQMQREQARKREKEKEQEHKREIEAKKFKLSDSKQKIATAFAEVLNQVEKMNNFVIEDKYGIKTYIIRKDKVDDRLQKTLPFGTNNEIKVKVFSPGAFNRANTEDAHERFHFLKEVALFRITKDNDAKREEIEALYQNYKTRLDKIIENIPASEKNNNGEPKNFKQFARAVRELLDEFEPELMKIAYPDLPESKAFKDFKNKADEYLIEKRRPTLINITHDGKISAHITKGKETYPSSYRKSSLGGINSNSVVEVSARKIPEKNNVVVDFIGSRATSFSVLDFKLSKTEKEEKDKDKNIERAKLNYENAKQEVIDLLSGMKLEDGQIVCLHSTSLLTPLANEKIKNPLLKLIHFKSETRQLEDHHRALEMLNGEELEVEVEDKDKETGRVTVTVKKVKVFIDHMNFSVKDPNSVQGKVNKELQDQTNQRGFEQFRQKLFVAFDEKLGPLFNISPDKELFKKLFPVSGSNSEIIALETSLKGMYDGFKKSDKSTDLNNYKQTKKEIAALEKDLAKLYKAEHEKIAAVWNDPDNKKAINGLKSHASAMIKATEEITDENEKIKEKRQWQGVRYFIEVMERFYSGRYVGKTQSFVFAALLTRLSELADIIPMWNCKSSKDRSGWLANFINLLIELEEKGIDFFNVLDQLDKLKNIEAVEDKKLKANLRKIENLLSSIHEYSASLDAIAYNTPGGRGNRMNNPIGYDKSGYDKEVNGWQRIGKNLKVKLVNLFRKQKLKSLEEVDSIFDTLEKEISYREVEHKNAEKMLNFLQDKKDYHSDEERNTAIGGAKKIEISTAENLKRAKEIHDFLLPFKNVENKDLRAAMLSVLVSAQDGEEALKLPDDIEDIIQQINKLGSKEIKAQNISAENYKNIIQRVKDIPGLNKLNNVYLMGVLSDTDKEKKSEFQKFNDNYEAAPGSVLDALDAKKKKVEEKIGNLNNTRKKLEVSISFAKSLNLNITGELKNKLKSIEKDIQLFENQKERIESNIEKLQTSPFEGLTFAKGKDAGANDAGEFGGVYKDDAGQGYMVKQDTHHEKIRNDKVILEVMAGHIIHECAGGLAAEVDFIRTSKNSAGVDETGESIYVKSKWINNYKGDLWEFAYKQYNSKRKEEDKIKIPSERPKRFGSNKELKNIVVGELQKFKDQSLLKKDFAAIMAASLLAGDFDVHPGNVGVKEEDGHYRLVRLDYGGAFLFISDEVHPHSHLRHLPYLNKNFVRQPTNHYREFPRWLRVSEEMAEALDKISEQNFDEIIEKDIGYLRDNYELESIQQCAKRIGIKPQEIKGKTKGGLLDYMQDYLQEKIQNRQASLKEYAFEIRLDLCIQAVKEEGSNQTKFKIDYMKLMDLVDDKKNPEYKALAIKALFENKVHLRGKEAKDQNILRRWNLSKDLLKEMQTALGLKFNPANPRTVAECNEALKLLSDNFKEKNPPAWVAKWEKKLTHKKEKLAVKEARKTKSLSPALDKELGNITNAVIQHALRNKILDKLNKKFPNETFEETFPHKVGKINRLIAEDISSITEINSKYTKFLEICTTDPVVPGINALQNDFNAAIVVQHPEIMEPKKYSEEIKKQTTEIDKVTDKQEKYKKLFEFRSFVQEAIKEIGEQIKYINTTLAVLRKQYKDDPSHETLTQFSNVLAEATAQETLLKEQLIQINAHQKQIRSHINAKAKARTTSAPERPDASLSREIHGARARASSAPERARKIEIESDLISRKEWLMIQKAGAATEKARPATVIIEYRVDKKEEELKKVYKSEELKDVKKRIEATKRKNPTIVGYKDKVICHSMEKLKEAKNLHAKEKFVEAAIKLAFEKFDYDLSKLEISGSDEYVKMAKDIGARLVAEHNAKEEKGVKPEGSNVLGIKPTNSIK